MSGKLKAVHLNRFGKQPGLEGASTTEQQYEEKGDVAINPPKTQKKAGL